MGELSYRDSVLVWWDPVPSPAISWLLRGGQTSSAASFLCNELRYHLLKVTGMKKHGFEPLCHESEKKSFILLWFSQLHSPNYGKLTSTINEHRSNWRFMDCVFVQICTHTFTHILSHTEILASREFEFVNSECLEINFSWVTKNTNFPSVKNWTLLILSCSNMTREKKVWLIKAEQKTGQTAWRMGEKVPAFLRTSTVGNRLWYFSCGFRKRHVISPSLEWF